MCECERAKVEWGSATELTEPGSAPSNSAVLGGRVEDWPLGLGVCVEDGLRTRPVAEQPERKVDGGRTDRSESSIPISVALVGLVWSRLVDI